MPMRGEDGSIEMETREGRILDVAEDAKLIYVAQGDQVIWVKLEEAVEVLGE